MFGTVGVPIPKVEIKIGDNNEILAKGPNVMMGYYKQPDITAQTLDSDGWLHTGDCGEWIDGKFLKITGRVKALFKKIEDSLNSRSPFPIPRSRKASRQFCIQ